MMDSAAAIVAIIGGIIGIIGSVCGLFAKFNAYAKAQQARSDRDDEWHKAMDSRMDALQMDVLRLVVVSGDMPLPERLAAGAKYIEMGGNGYVHAIVEQLEEKVITE